MKAIDVLRTALRWSDEEIRRIVADMSEAPLTPPTARGGNHPLWVLGHLAFVEGFVPGIVLGPDRESNPMEHYRELFGTGSEPTADASRYPSFEELLGRCRSLRERNLRLLEEVGDGRLDERPAFVPPGFEDVMTSIGNVFLLIAVHQMVHYGQVADARRAAGKAPLI